MILITKLCENNKLMGFNVKGHANYSIPGRDIVCAAVSAITVNTINSINELSSTAVDQIDWEDGNTQFKLSKSDLSSRILLEAALIGYKGIAEQYPDYVAVE